MKTIILAIVMVLGYHSSLAHGGHSAIYKYKIDPTSIVLEFQIEKSLLVHFDLSKDCDSYESATALCLFNYLTEKNILKLNQNEIAFSLEGSRQDEKFFKLTMTSAGDYSSSMRISLINTCFLEFDKAFENRIIIESSDSFKSYLLNFEKSEITIE